MKKLFFFSVAAIQFNPDFIWTKFKSAVVCLSFFIFNLSFLIDASAQPPNLPGSGNCLSFNGTSDYVQLTSGSALNPTSTVTVEAWVQLTSLNNQAQIFDNCSASPWYGYNLFITTTNQVSFGIYGSTGVFGATTLSVGIWYHIVGVYDGSTERVYLNGQLDGSIAMSGLINYAVTVNPRIGKRSVLNTQFFPGQIDEVRIWNTARTQTQIRDNMCQKLTGSEAGLVGYWRFDESSGTTATDSSPNGNNGTLK